jgi:tRNA(fMet)-specific endonuclease VapC
MAGVRFLLDTNIVSEPVVAQPQAIVLERIREHSGSLAISVVTWQELLYGMLLLPLGKRRDRIEDYLFRRVRPAIPLIDFDERAAQWQAEERARLRQTGSPPSYPDSQIAATAAVNNLVLVTRNRADFTQFQGLRIENWFQSPGADGTPA